MNRAQWGVKTSPGWMEYEEDLIASAKPPTPQAHDNAAEREVLLVDRRGNPLIVREPRPVGFRKR